MLFTHPLVHTLAFPLLRLLVIGVFLFGLNTQSWAHEPTSTKRTILVIGDSLAAEYGIKRDTGWVAEIGRRLESQALGYQVVNSSISGDTTQGGLNRLPDLLSRHQPAIVIIELGSNDALRGLVLESTRANLASMIEQSQATNADVLLIGMQIPPNYGRRYSESFRQMFQELAQTHSTELVPFLFEGFATQREMFQDDAIHPNEQAQTRMADLVWPHLVPML